MSSRKNIFITLGFVLSVSLIAAAWLVSYHYSRASFNLVNAVCSDIIAQEPGMQKIISAALKECADGNSDGYFESNLLSSLGYRAHDFPDLKYKQIAPFALAGWILGILIFLFTVFYRNKAENRRIRNLAEYLEQVNSGKAGVLSVAREDEIYKTVTSLYQTKDRAIQAKNDYAENLSNIAHQIKTPITAASLALQRVRSGF